MITFTTLGAGQFYLTPGDTTLYNSAGHLVETPQAKVVFDLGRGCLRALTELGVSVHDIDVVCISHLHPDHVADMLAFFQTHFVEYKQLPERRNKQLTIIGPVGTQGWVTKQLQFLFDELPYDPTVIEAPEQWEMTDFILETRLLFHTIPNIGFRLTSEEKTIVYSGDTGYIPALDELAKGADTLVLECSNDSGQVTPYHLSPEECGTVATTAGARQLVITHYGQLNRQAALATATQEKFHGIVVFGQSGQRLCMS